MKKMLIVAKMETKYTKEGLTKWMKELKAHFAKNQIIFAIYFPEKNVPSDIETLTNVYAFSDNQVNPFGKLKTPELKSVFGSQYDTSLIFGDLSKKITRILNKCKSRVKIGTNVNSELDCNIKLCLDSKEIAVMTNFTTEIIEKIAP